MKKKYDVAVEHKGEVLFRKKFFFLRNAENLWWKKQVSMNVIWT